MQLDLFDQNLDENILFYNQLVEVFNRCENVRKGAFKKISDLSKLVLSLQKRNELLEQRLYLIESKVDLNNNNFDFKLEIENERMPKEKVS